MVQPQQMGYPAAYGGYYGGYYGQAGVPGQPQPGAQAGAADTTQQPVWDAATTAAYYAQNQGWGGYYGQSASSEHGSKLVLRNEQPSRMGSRMARIKGVINWRGGVYGRGFSLILIQ